MLLVAASLLLVYSDYLSDDDQSVTTESAFFSRFIPEIHSVHIVFLEIVFFKSMRKDLSSFTMECAAILLLICC